MEALKNTIQITLIYKGEEHLIRTFPNGYYSLMTLIADNLAIPGFGLCCGMGSCGTCLVQLARPRSSVKVHLLACAVLINDDLANAVVHIPDGTY